MKNLQRCIVPAVVVAACITVILGAAGCDMANCHHMVGRSAEAPAATAEGKPLQLVNDRCPIMGIAIDPATVPASLVRDYNGQKVAFCCGGCPGMWDMLPAGQKDKKLQAVISAR